MKSPTDQTADNRLEVANERLAAAVDRLERALIERTGRTGAADTEMAAAMQAARAEYESLRSATTTVSERLDNTIDRLKSVLES